MLNLLTTWLAILTTIKLLEFYLCTYSSFLMIFQPNKTCGKIKVIKIKFSMDIYNILAARFTFITRNCCV